MSMDHGSNQLNQKNEVIGTVWPGKSDILPCIAVNVNSLLRTVSFNCSGREKGIKKWMNDSFIDKNQIKRNTFY